jgi:hypothetical protein
VNSVQRAGHSFGCTVELDMHEVVRERPGVPDTPCPVGFLARIIHGLPSRERRECRRFGALGPEGDAGVLAQYVEEAGGRRSRKCGTLDARSRELMNNPG